MPALSDIRGHERETGRLKAAISAKRVAHAYLFSGHDGIGKRLIALAFAKALNCADIDANGESCGSCPDCSMAEAGTHPNIIQIQPVDKDDEPASDGTIKIAQVRELQDALRYKTERGKKAAIVEGADRMALPAANAFLKTLEEPPASSVIILIASKTAELPATIISRCQRINFKPLPVSVIRDYLIEKIGAAPDEAEAAARLSEGSIPAAMNCLGTGFLEKRSETLTAFLSLRPDDTVGILKLAEELSKRDDLEEALEYLKTMLRDSIVSLEGRPDLAISRSGLFKIAGRGGLTVERLIDSYSLIERARADIMPPRYANKQLAMEDLLMGLTGSMAI